MCWHPHCILADCDGANHTDETGLDWYQYEGQRYCTACGDYVYHEDCAHDDFED